MEWFSTFRAFFILLMIIFPGYWCLRITCSSLPGGISRIKSMNNFQILIVSSLLGMFPFLSTLWISFVDIHQLFQVDVLRFLWEDPKPKFFDTIAIENIIPKLAFLIAFFIVINCLILPLIWGNVFGLTVILLKRLKGLGFSPEEYIQSAWDYYFFKSRYLDDILIITAKDNETIIGSIGKEGFFSTANQYGDLYLTKLYNYNRQDKKITENESSSGIWISKESILRIEMLKLDHFNSIERSNHE